MAKVDSEHANLLNPQEGRPLITSPITTTTITTTTITTTNITTTVHHSLLCNLLNATLKLS